MSELYDFIDHDGDGLRIVRDEAHGYVTVSKEAGPASVVAPTGEEAVALARAVLAAGGDTGHEVVSAEDVAKVRRENASLQQVATRAEKDVATLTADRDRLLEESAAIAARIFADEQKCQEAFVKNPTSLSLNGKLAGLQRARDIATEVAPPMPPSAWPEDGDDLGCGTHCPCGGPSSATAPRDTELAQTMRAAMKRYGVPAVLGEAGRLAQQRL